MLSPNDISPKSTAASIWSIDSGYGSNTIDEDDSPQFQASNSIWPMCEADMDSHQTQRDEPSATQQVYSQSMEQPIGLGLGLGLGGFWNTHVEDQLRVSRAEIPAEPATAELNDFTTRPSLATNFLLPPPTNYQSICSTCHLWNITNPGENLKCDDCRREKAVVTPQSQQSRPQRAKSAVPQLDIPHQQQIIQHPASSRVTRCSACEISTLIDPTNASSCPSCRPTVNVQPPKPPVIISRVRRSCARRSSKLPAYALQCLQIWLQENRNNPYPDAETKRSLAKECGITKEQVNTWFTNVRARHLKSSVDQSNQHSEDEGNCDPVIRSVASIPAGSNGIAFNYTTPLDPRTFDNSASAAKGLNYNSSAISRRGKKKDYGLIKAPSPIEDQSSPVLTGLANPVATQTDKELEQWQCTFCYVHVAPKSWRRHEETQHRPKRKWTCLLDGPRLTLPSRFNSSNVCVFCMEENPSEEHFVKSHRIVDCLQKSEEERTFLRPDHLRQHVRNFHKVTLYEVVRDSWRQDGPGKNDVENWTCGFCGLNLKTWDMRETHIAGHFKDGKTMADWSEQRRSDSPIETTKRRRNSKDGSRNRFTKLARTLTGRSHRRTENQTQQTDFTQTFNPFQTSAGPPMSTMPLLQDMVFHPFVPDMSGNPVDTFNPMVSCADEPFNPIVTSADGQYPSHVHVPGTQFGAGEELDIDLDELAAAFLNRNPTDFTGPWDQQPQ